jgi:transposase
LLQTITGVGPVLSVATVVKTKNFTQFNDPRKFACYCGTAPFEHSSGKSIRKKTKISHLADKSMKTLLDQSAKSAIQYDKELKQFYERRLEMGKSKKSTINIVHNMSSYPVLSSNR